MVRRRALAGLGIAGVLALVALAAGAIALRSPAPAPEPERAAVALPAPVAPAFTPGRPRPLGSTRHLSHWAPVLRRVAARAAPDPAAPVVARVSTHTPEGTRNVVAVVERARDRRGGGWVHVRLAVLPNGMTGWIPRAALGGYGTVATRLEVDLGLLRATLYRAGRAVLRAPVAVGGPGWETPRGEFYVRNRLTRYSSPEYGPVAFGTSARSPNATDWPAGGFVGIHGTDRPELVPGRVSHGCIRMRNADVLALARRMPVGTPVTIR
jgi:lipoprotein-anchoring transpeptidase ErfK/SrfK